MFIASDDIICTFSQDIFIFTNKFTHQIIEINKQQSTKP